MFEEVDSVSPSTVGRLSIFAICDAYGPVKFPGSSSSRRNWKFDRSETIHEKGGNYEFLTSR